MRGGGCPTGLWRWLVVGCFLFAVGCSGAGSLNSVQGKVIYRKEPIKGVLVTFHPKGGDPIKAIRPTGYTKDDGTFVVSTGDGQGAPVGEYIVTFVCPKDSPPKGKKPVLDPGLIETRDFFDGVYADVGQSKFRVEIKRGQNNLEPFVLK